MPEFAEPPSYQEILSFLFDRPHPSGSLKEWYWDLSYELNNVFEHLKSPDNMVDLYGYLLRHSGRDLSSYSDTQVEMGLRYLFFNSGSSEINRFYECRNKSKRNEAVRNMKYLYRDCFKYRCRSVLCHLGEGREHRLTGLCYMLWDDSPIASAGRPGKFEVLEDALYIPNDACVESALHGLGHLQKDEKEWVAAIIDRFLEKQRYMRPELRRYAESARLGDVQ